jgi:hypothetical protein
MFSVDASLTTFDTRYARGEGMLAIHEDGRLLSDTDILEEDG